MTDKIQDMERVLAQVDVLHSSPHVACKALSLLQDDLFDVCELTRILKSDPALTTSILRLVNSSFFGVSCEISSLQQAVTLLGSRALRLAVLSFGLLKRLNEDAPAQIYQEYWKRSLTMAAAASRLTGFNDTARQDEAYSAGLLSDIGVLVFAQVRTDDYVPIYQQHHQSATLIAEEEHLFGFNHAELGAYLLGKWNLPSGICQAVLQHHSPSAALSGLDFVVATSDLIATSLWTPDSASVITAQEVLQESFGVDMDGFIDFAIEIQQMIDENAQLFAVNLNDSIDCDKLLNAARQQYQSLAMEAALDVDSMSSVLADHSGN